MINNSHTHTQIGRYEQDKQYKNCTKNFEQTNKEKTNSIPIFIYFLKISISILVLSTTLYSQTYFFFYQSSLLFNFFQINSVFYLSFPTPHPQSTAHLKFLSSQIFISHFSPQFICLSASSQLPHSCILIILSCNK